MGAQGALVEAEVLGREGPHGPGAPLPQRVHREAGSHQLAGRLQLQVEVAPEARQPQVQRAPAAPGRLPPPAAVRDRRRHVVAVTVHLVGRHQVVF